VSMLALPDGDLGVVAVAERFCASIENVGEADSQPLLWDAYGDYVMGKEIRGLFWLRDKPAICCAWESGAALFDGCRPERPIASSKLSEERIAIALGRGPSTSVLVDGRGGLYTWDFRTPLHEELPPLGRRTEWPGRRTAWPVAAADPSGFGAAVVLNSAAGPVLAYRDIRKNWQPTRSVHLLDVLRKSNLDGDLSVVATHMSFGRAGDINVALRSPASSYFASFAGGAEMCILGAWQCKDFDVTALCWKDSDALVAVAKRARVGNESVAELRAFGKASERREVPKPSPVQKPKAKKMFRKHDSGDSEFRVRRGTRR